MQGILELLKEIECRCQKISFRLKKVTEVCFYANFHVHKSKTNYNYMIDEFM